MATVTYKDFAASQGWSHSYVTKLKDQGRLVLEGKRILVDETLALIAQTAGTRDDVSRRNAENRSQPKTGGGATLPPENDSMEKARRVKAVSDARRVAALADQEEMMRDKMAGDLVAREDVEAAMKFVGAAVRSLMDVFPDQNAAVLAPVQDHHEIHAMLTEQCNDVLLRLGDAIERQREALAKGEAGGA
jgi:hypothetical protein